MATTHNIKTLSFLLFLSTLLSTLTLTRCQENFELHYQLREQVPQSTWIGNIINDANLAAIYPAALLDRLQFGLLSGVYNSYFQLSTRGVLTTKDPLDREVVCPSAAECVVSVSAALLQPAENFTVFNIRVTVQDRNDYTPSFQQQRLVINMSESTLPGAEFLIPPATDLDSRQFGVSYYEFIPPMEEFDLIHNINGDGNDDLFLRLSRQLDREIRTRYILTLRVYDGGEPPKTGSMEIEINLVDHNDNSPVFERNFYNITVDEDFGLSRPIVRVNASDADAGLNGQVRYALSTQTRSAYGNQFRIDSNTGEITLGAPLDFETHSLYVLTVEASDHGVGALPAVARVHLHVRDVNDHPPTITISGLAAQGSVAVAEEGVAGTAIAHISVSDQDTGLYGEVRCVAPGVRDFELRSRQSSTYILMSTGSYDYEAQSSYNVPIICSDGGSPAMSTLVDITVSIIDINDNAPIFDTNTYALRFRENNSISAPVLQVTATDRDSDENGRVTYELSPEARGVLAINENTGSISALVSFDYERMTTFQFYVTARDHGSPQKTDNTTVVITLIDINDEAPRFSQPEGYSFGTFENQPIGTEIGTIQATDADSPPYNQFTFSLDAQSTARNVFSIDPQTGEIRTLKMLDREHETSYNLVAIATNTALPRLSTSVGVTVYVVDRNDNAPSIEFPSRENSTASVQSTASRGTVFSRIIARDADLGRNARLQFSIASGDDEGLFSLEVSNGALSVARDLTTAQRSEYELLIMVRDSGDEEHKAAVATLTIHINETTPSAGSSDKLGGIAKLTESHRLVIIILSAVTVVLVIILVTAIIFIKRRQAAVARAALAGSQYKVEVAHHTVTQQQHNGDLSRDGEEMQISVKPPPEQYGHQAPPGGDRTHLTLEDIKRMKCLYRNTPDVARHAYNAAAREETTGNAYNVRKNAEMQGIFDLLNDGENLPDDHSTDSADSGRGTSEPSQEAHRTALTTAQALLLHPGPQAHTQSHRGGGGAGPSAGAFSTFSPPSANSKANLQGNRFNRGSPCTKTQMPSDSTFNPNAMGRNSKTAVRKTGGNILPPTQQKHVTFDQTPIQYSPYKFVPRDTTEPSVSFHKANKQNQLSPIPSQSQNIPSHSPPIMTSTPNIIVPSQFNLPPSHSPRITSQSNMTSLPSHVTAPSNPVYASHSEISEYGETTSLASSTSGEYIVQLDMGRESEEGRVSSHLQAVDV